MTRFHAILIVLVILVLVAVGWFLLNQRSISRDTTPNPFDITSGQRVRSIAHALKQAKLIRNEQVFVFYVFLHGVSGKLQAGTYELSPSMNLPAIVKGIASGKAMSNELIIQIPEGWNSQQMGAYFQQKGLFSSADLDAAVATTDIHTLLPNALFSIISDKPATANLEGYLFPDTYRVFKNAKPADIINRMLANAQAKIGGELETAIHAQGKTVFQILTLASILEREVKTEQDRKLAADVFWKRISAGIGLQSDATIAYFTGKPINELTAADFAADSPYNTYKYRGLPIGPISNPGLISIRAAVYPQANPYYYFLTKDDGTAVFSVTLDEHNANKAKYLR